MKGIIGGCGCRCWREKGDRGWEVEGGGGGAGKGAGWGRVVRVGDGMIWRRRCDTEVIAQGAGERDRYRVCDGLGTEGSVA